MELHKGSKVVKQPSKATTDHTLYTRDWPVPNCKAVIYILHGFGEHCHRYEPFIKILNESGYCVASHDHIGHGHSGGERIHIDHFDTYVQDALELIKAKKDDYPGKRMILFGHSMGGLIATLCLIEKPGLFEGCILCSPCLAVHSKYNKVWLRAAAKILAKVDPMFYLTNGALDPEDVIADPVCRADYMSDPLVWHYGARAGSGNAMNNAMRTANEGLHQINVRTLVQHGREDLVCDVEAVKQFADMPTCTLKIYEGAKHVLLQDTHEIRQLAITDILDFLREMTDA